MLAIRFNKCW